MKIFIMCFFEKLCYGDEMKKKKIGTASRKFLKKKNFVAIVRERTIPTERKPLVGEVSANFCREKMSRG
jgi:hypothetical protein